MRDQRPRLNPICNIKPLAVFTPPRAENHQEEREYAPPEFFVPWLISLADQRGGRRRMTRIVRMTRGRTRSLIKSASCAATDIGVEDGRRELAGGEDVGWTLKLDGFVIKS